MPYAYTLAAALVLASVYVLGPWLRTRSRHRFWVSVAAGVSVSAVFIDLLPEIAEGQAVFSASSHRDFAVFPEQAIFMAAMLGFTLFYGLQYLVVAPTTENESGRTFWSLRIAAFSGYSSLIAYLMVQDPRRSVVSLILYTLAMAFHFLLVYHSLFTENHESQRYRGRWILAFAVLTGWVAGISVSIPEHWMARIVGFVCGGVIMNTLVVELPEGRGGRFWPFVLAAGAFSTVLILGLG